MLERPIEKQPVFIEQPRVVVNPINFTEVHTNTTRKIKQVLGFSERGLHVFKVEPHESFYAISLIDSTRERGLERIVVPVKKAYITRTNAVCYIVQDAFLLGYIGRDKEPLLTYDLSPTGDYHLVAGEVEVALQWLNIGIIRSSMINQATVF